KAAIVRFCGQLERLDLMAAQSAYVSLFDGVPSLSLYLFGHVHGDSRERGQAMADLVEDYRRAGLVLTGGELPDFLPVSLEYVSLHPAEHARAAGRNRGYCGAAGRAAGEAGERLRLGDARDRSPSVPPGQPRSGRGAACRGQARRYGRGARQSLGRGPGEFHGTRSGRDRVPEGGGDRGAV
ncbi:MAG: nitrate reductase molybdenum cofactor assembly chaperone, partial [Acetobacteraceae bacterium]|nr:nitrate reductase molybdenum cofactor assembly chaperone [Acetobacteraceae bacterium]